MILRVEIATHCNKGIRLEIEYPFEQESEFERLSSPLYSRGEKSFSPPRNSFPSVRSGLLPSDGHGEGSPQMHITHMQVTTAWKRKDEVLQRSVPCERGRIESWRIGAMAEK